MFGTQDLWLFIASSLLVNLSPGPDSLLVVTCGTAWGWRAGAAAAWGIGAGVFVHVLSAALGLSALLAASPMAMTVLQYVGAAYLVWMGLALWRVRRAPSPSPSPGSAPAGPGGPAAAGPEPRFGRLFWRGFLSNVTNPKPALFFLAFVPQFIAPDAPSKPLAFLFLGCIFNLGGTGWCHVLAALSGHASRRLRVSESAARWFSRGVGLAFVAIGLRLALSSLSVGAG
jgi:threonine/homoserine/homoserine lactone efflux protein